MASTGGCPTISDIPVEILEQIIKRAAAACRLPGTSQLPQSLPSVAVHRRQIVPRQASRPSSPRGKTGRSARYTHDRLASSSQGWLVTDNLIKPNLISTPLHVNLYNPFFCTNLTLPAIPYSPSFLLSSSLFNKDCVVLAIKRGSSQSGEDHAYAFWRGDVKTWKRFVGPVNKFSLEDMIPYRDGYCGLYGQGSGIMQLSLSSSPEVIKRTRVKVQREDVRKSREKYLVKSSNGDLLMVVLVPSCDDGDGQLASGFEVFRLDWCKREWTVVKSLGNHAIFLARYGSTCVEASGNPAATGCIYLFSDSGLRIYNVESRSFQATKPKKIPNSVCHWFCPDVGCKSR
ncbi:hypothetical protein Tsubulata_050190 [Turnera subulata]|uniref:KIB1-4 beta-propeller domain-containing protein n=1 Tax=Turnera subulata TaxID=218843 RepID=A0A9Q0JCK4_9ROSI|nr:hypothetical protein Tsubulata_050190 [Turnera subulata]